MTKLPQSALPQLYAQLMTEIKLRLAAIDDALQSSAGPTQATVAFLQLEFCYLQLRRSIELIAIAVLLANNEIEDFRTRDFMKDWNAGLLFKRLEGLSNDAFPDPAIIQNRDEHGAADLLIGDDAAVNRLKIAAIYAACGDKLHAGSLKGLLKSPKQYDAAEIQEWRSFLVRLLNHHVVLLPGRTAMMTVFMTNDVDGKVKCELLAIAPGDIPIGTPPRQPPAP